MISIIVPVYNVEKYLEACIQSIIEQTYCDIEIILIDDGSTDLSGEICDNLQAVDKRIHVIHKSNGGLSSARNAGIEYAKGDYIGFVDSDDMINELMFEKLFNIMECDSTIDISSCGIEQFQDGNFSKTNIFLKCYQKTFSAIDYLSLVLEHKIDNAVCNKLYRKCSIGDIRFKENLINEDLVFTIEILTKIRKITYISETYYKYRIRKGSITQQANPKLFDFVTNALWVKDMITNKKQYTLFTKAEGYIYHEITNYITTIEKYNSTTLYKKEMNYCKHYILDHPLQSFRNSSWSKTQKIKFFLVSYFPTLYRYLLKFW